MSAQGIALGIYQGDNLALKGRHNLCVSCICFALSGRGVSDLIVLEGVALSGPGKCNAACASKSTAMLTKPPPRRSRGDLPRCAGEVTGFCYSLLNQ